MSEPVAILTDTTKCTGCELCVEACKKEYDLGRDQPWRGRGSVNDLSSSRRCTVLSRPGHRYVRQQCRHCLEPACVSACLVGAMQKTPEGPVIYDSDRCMGCRYCLAACPYGIPRYEWDERVPYVSKCTLCADRIRDGKEPACVEACPEEATIFGSRSELLREAHRRIAAEPDKYYPKVFGEDEVGGTSVLYISDVSLDFLAWKPDLGTTPLPALTSGALHKVPPTILLMGGLMTGLYWVIGRRMRLASEEGVGDTPSETVDTAAAKPPGTEDGS
jgi:formate dehydrogenase iron-sulfur subunit